MAHGKPIVWPGDDSPKCFGSDLDEPSALQVGHGRAPNLKLPRSDPADWMRACSTGLLAKFGA